MWTGPSECICLSVCLFDCVGVCGGTQINHTHTYTYTYTRTHTHTVKDHFMAIWNESYVGGEVDRRGTGGAIQGTMGYG